MVIEASRTYLPFTAARLDDPRHDPHPDGLKFVRRYEGHYD
jgi:spermidine synthase